LPSTLRYDELPGAVRAWLVEADRVLSRNAWSCWLSISWIIGDQRTVPGQWTQSSSRAAVSGSGIDDDRADAGGLRCVT
jgi:hypothetical protein